MTLAKARKIAREWREDIPEAIAEGKRRHAAAALTRGAKSKCSTEQPVEFPMVDEFLETLVEARGPGNVGGSVRKGG